MPRHVPTLYFSAAGPPRLQSSADARWLDAAARLASRGMPLSRPNPAVGAIIIKDGIVIGRGWTQPGGRPHAEAKALEQAGEAAQGATLYVTLEPCAHASPRGPACADLVAASGLARIVAGCGDPDPRTAGTGIARIRSAGKFAELLANPASARSLAGYLTRVRLGRPHVTLKLALSEDGFLAPARGQWLTGEVARAQVHAWRARMDAILVGRGTLEMDQPRLDVRLPGIAARSPQRWLLTHRNAPEGWHILTAPEEIAAMQGVQYLMVEGGAKAARAFLNAGLVDRLLLYRAPLTVGGDGPAMPALTRASLAHNGHWTRTESRLLGKDTLDLYEVSPCSPE